VTAYERWDGIYRAFDDVLNWLSISAGVAISLTVSLSAPKWFPISLGVLVTLLQAVRPMAEARTSGCAVWSRGRRSP
jgi:hypothetical protein